MQKQTERITFGCLLSALAELNARAGRSSAQGFPESAALLAMVDGARRCVGTGMASPCTKTGSAPLQSIFTHMNGYHPGRMVRWEKEIPAQYYGTLAESMEALVEKWGEAGIYPLLSWMESALGEIPAWPWGECDISLYDRVKLTAAVGACISEYWQAVEAERPFSECTDVQQRQMFLLYSAGLSGIQEFIYTVSQAKALRALRSRSFFLGFFMEHYVDELLTACGLSRANLLYLGGGHCYLLLPNTPQTEKKLAQINERFNEFLQAQFGVSLFVAHGWAGCSADDLNNFPAEQMPYGEILRKVNTAVSRHKLHRYSADQLRRMNRRESGGQRECRVCGRSDDLPADGDCCSWCAVFEALSSKLQRFSLCVVSRQALPNSDFSLPGYVGNRYVYFCSASEAEQIQAERIYFKNSSPERVKNGIRMTIADYSASNQMAELADGANGIRRIAVCRMDVDNMGQAFQSGFEDTKATTPAMRQRFVSLMRTTAFSRQMAWFFQKRLNELLEETQPSIAVVYSGGDDVFLVGAWDDVVRSAQYIQKAFAAFSGGALTISAGIGIFGEKHPIRLAAWQTAELEDCAKKQPGKNAVCLFDADERYTFSWACLEQQVIGQKERELVAFFDGQEERGMAFLYHLLELLRRAQEPDGKINLARYAYLLSRLEPAAQSAQQTQYRAFATNMYDWARNEKDRNQLIAACYLFAYRRRS